VYACEEALLAQSDDYWARYVKALSQMRLRQMVDAKAELTVCLRLMRAKDAAWPRLMRGFAASEQGARHLETLKQLPALHPLAALAKKQADAEFRSAESDFATALQQNSDPLVQYVGLANRGALNIYRLRWNDAVKNLQQALQVNPSGIQAYINLAQAWQGMQKWEEAQAALTEAIRLVPDVPALYESRAGLSLTRGQFADAQDDFQKAIDLATRDGKPGRLANLYAELGRLLHRDKKYAEALAKYDRALQVQPRFLLAQRLRAETLAVLGDLDQAAVALDTYLAVTRPAPAGAYQLRGLIHAGKGKMPAAIEMYSAALQLDPKDFATRGYRGWAYLFADSARLALADFDACVRDDAANTDALLGRGNARIRLRQVDKAIEDAQAAEKQGLKEHRAWYNLARIYAQAASQLDGEAPANLLPLTMKRIAQYKERAANALGKAVDLHPRKLQAEFWKTQVQADPAFAALRGTVQYARLAARCLGP
jgi:tetratricopeptide (TPR) repeat protein